MALIALQLLLTCTACERLVLSCVQSVVESRSIEVPDCRMRLGAFAGAPPEKPSETQCKD